MIINSSDLTTEQVKCQDTILGYIDNPIRPYLTVGGYAGVGKTTVIASTRQLIKDISIAFCAFTGKAAYILKQKLTSIDALMDRDYCGTIHGLIYEKVEVEGEGKKKVYNWIRNNSIPYDLIIVDEASMLNEVLFTDLLSYGVPIVAIGDHGQLPPVKGRFNLMEKPDVVLETIHRQVADHPIIKVATMARRYGNIPLGDHGEGVRKVMGSQCLKDMNLSSWLVLCGKNRTRTTMNDAIRGSVSRTPIKMDKVICLRNNRQEGLFNGMVGVLVDELMEPEEKDKTDPHGRIATIRFDDFTWEGMIHLPQFGQERTLDAYNKSMGCLFDFGYCLTVWKAQGSEADNVILIEEQVGPPDRAMYARFLYTAVTRAKKQLLIIG